MTADYFSTPHSDPIHLVSPTPVSSRADRAHEQMNALSVISSVAALVKPGLSERDRVRMARLDRAVRRLEQLVRSEVETASFVEVPDAGIDVGVLVAGACEELREKTDRMGIRLVVDCGGGSLLGNATTLRETLFNLLDSAVDSAKPGQQVHLETRSTETGDQIWTIRQSSPGAPDRVMLSAAGAMSIGGSLAFESKEGGGTTVRVWLPRDGTTGNPQTVSVRLRPVEWIESRERA